MITLNVDVAFICECGRELDVAEHEFKANVYVVQPCDYCGDDQYQRGLGDADD